MAESNSKDSAETANLSATKTVIFRGNAPGSTSTVVSRMQGSATSRIFLLSPANIAGIRAQRLLKSTKRSDLADRLRAGAVPVDELFSFMSSLYFRGKLIYAQTFATPPAGQPGTLIITPSRGLLRPETLLSLEDIREMSSGRVDLADDRYRAELKRDTCLLTDNLGPDAEVVLLGSIATQKYVQPLTEILGGRLVFPSAFVGRGNLSRGGLLLRCVRDRIQLDYIPVATATRSGNRPARLLPLCSEGGRRKN